MKASQKYSSARKMKASHNMKKVSSFTVLLIIVAVFLLAAILPGCTADKHAWKGGNCPATRGYTGYN